MPDPLSPTRPPARVPAASTFGGWAPTGLALLVGVGVLAAGFVLFRLLSGILVPGAAALILAVLVLPFTDWLGRRVPRGVAVGAVLLLVALAAVAVTVLFARGLLDQGPEIQAALQSAATRVQDAVGGAAGEAASAAINAASRTAQSPGLLTGWVAGAIGSIVPVLMGLFTAAMVLFLVLLDPSETRGWFTRIVPWPPAQSDRFLTTAGQVIRDYVKGATILALVNAIPIWAVARLLGTPGAAAILVVMFVTAYIPYVGAWLGGAFAVLMALGSGGTTEAVIMLAAVLVVNLGLQSIAQPFAFHATMRVSALGVFLVTLLGGLIAGVFGAMLAAPLVAMMTRYPTDVRHVPSPTDPASTT